MRVSAIIYGELSGIVRRIVVSDSLAELAAPSALATGEAAIILDPNDVLTPKGVPDLAAAYSLVEAKRGKPSGSARVVIIDDKSGEIEGVTLADPLIDILPSKTLVQDDKADVDWTRDANGVFVAPVVAEVPVELVADPVAKDGG